MTDGGPVRPRQLGKMECQGKAITILAKARPKNVNGGVEQAGENVQFRQDGIFVCFKNMFFPLRRLHNWAATRLGAQELASCPVGLEQRLARWKVSGQVLGKTHAFEAQKKPDPTCGFGPG